MSNRLHRLKWLLIVAWFRKRKVKFGKYLFHCASPDSPRMMLDRIDEIEQRVDGKRVGNISVLFFKDHEGNPFIYTPDGAYDPTWLWNAIDWEDRREIR